MIKRIAFFAVFVFVLSIGTARALQPLEADAPEKVLNELGVKDSVCIVLLDLTNNEVLFEQNAHTKAKTASTSKLLTCVVALENCGLDEVVTISRQAAGTGGSSLELKRDEQLSLYDLLSGMMVTSGNDAAHAVAQHVAGSQKAFAALMNETAQRIGMKDSNFTNSIGTSHTKNYSTAYDMAKLAEYAVQNEVITSLTLRSSYVMPQTNLQETREVFSTNMLLYQDSEFYYPYATGLKTGTSRKAKGSFVASAQKDGVNLVCVVMNDRSSGYTDRWHIAKAMFEYGFSKYTVFNVKEFLDKECEIKIDIGRIDDRIICGLGDMDEECLTIRKTDADTIFETGIVQNVTTQHIELPVIKGDTVGSVTIYNESTGIQLFSGQLIAQYTVYELKPMLDDIYIKEHESDLEVETIPDTSNTSSNFISKEIIIQFIFFSLLVIALILIIRKMMLRKLSGD